MKKNGLIINENKSQIQTHEEITFLGHKLSKGTIKPDDMLAERVKKIKPPKDRKEIESFLGLCQYYSKFIPNYSKRMLPLTDLKKKGADFNGLNLNSTHSMIL